MRSFNYLTIVLANYPTLGAEAQNRTADTTVFSRVLYQLSYLGALGPILTELAFLVKRRAQKTRSYGTHAAASRCGERERDGAFGERYGEYGNAMASVPYAGMHSP